MRFCLGILGCFWLAAGFSAEGQDLSARGTSVVRVDRRSGRLVRAMAAQPRPAPAGRVPEAVEKAARRNDLDPLLVHAVIQVESNYNPLALSPKGAEGLMQLMPKTARRFGVSNSFDVADNLQGGASYLRYLLDVFGDEQLALAAYNAGEQAVMRYGGIPPYPETRNYVRAVSSRYSRTRRADPVLPVSMEAPQPPLYRPIEQYVDAQGNLHLLTR